MTIEEEIFDFTSQLIERLYSAGHGNYKAAKSKMLLDFNLMYDGSWENHSDCSKFGLPNITIVQEDEFDGKSDEEQSDYGEWAIYLNAQYVFVG